jgi:hypothetical protein
LKKKTQKFAEAGCTSAKIRLMVLDYYPLIDNEGNVTEFAEVEALDDVKTNDGKKFCTKKLKIGAKLSLWQFIKASFDVAYQNIKSQVEVSESTRFAGDNNDKPIEVNHTEMIERVENDIRLYGKDLKCYVIISSRSVANSPDIQIVSRFSLKNLL